MSLKKLQIVGFGKICLMLVLLCFVVNKLRWRVYSQARWGLFQGMARVTKACKLHCVCYSNTTCPLVNLRLLGRLGQWLMGVLGKIQPRFSLFLINNLKVL